MAGLKEIMFIDGLIADKISSKNNTWAIIMGSYLHVLENGKEVNKYLLPFTYHSPVYFNNDNFICCHTAIIDIAKALLINHSLLSNCRTETDDVFLTENHIITRVAGSGNTALVSVNFFVPRNDGYEKKDSMNYLFLVSDVDRQTTCKLLSAHPNLPFDCTQISNRFWASFSDGLYLWEDGIKVDHGLTFDGNLQMEKIFFTSDEAQMVLINALGKLYVINTATWKIVTEQQLQKSNSILRITISLNGKLIATGNNEGDCYLYSKSGEGFRQILFEKMEGIITAIHINESQLLIGLNGTTRRGLICHEILE